MTKIPPIETIIPHRYPMLLIDQLIELEPGSRAVAIKNLTVNEWFFCSQTTKVMNRPLLVEALAQTGAAAILALPAFKGKTAFFGGIREATFFKQCHPGDQLTLTVELTKLKAQIGLGRGVITCDDQQICEAELVFAIE